MSNTTIREVDNRIKWQSERIAQLEKEKQALQDQITELCETIDILSESVIPE